MAGHWTLIRMLLVRIQSQENIKGDINITERVVGPLKYVFDSAGLMARHCNKQEIEVQFLCRVVPSKTLNCQIRMEYV